MKVRELVDILKKVTNQHAEISIKVNVSNSEEDSLDIVANMNIISIDSQTDEDFNQLDILVTPKEKRQVGNEFETLSELLDEGGKIEVHFDGKGMYFFVDGELRREMEFKKDWTPVSNTELTSEHVKKLIYEL